MKSASSKGLLILVGVAIVAGASYLLLQRSSLISGETSTGAFMGQAFPPILFFDSKAGVDKGCYDLKWSSLNVTSCTSNWRQSVVTNGTEQVCQGTKDTEGVRNISPNVGNITYTITCTGPAGSVARSIKVKNN